jgi:hypothetical protein
MIEKLRQKITGFITSPKDAPLLAGVAIGVYMIAHYYAKNLALAASWEQLLFFASYYLLLPVAVLFAGYKVFSIPKLLPYRSHFLFVAIPLFLAFYLLQLSFLGTYKRFIFAGVLIVFILVSLRFARYYKLFVVLLLLLSLFNVVPVASAGYSYITASDAWQQQPDGILTTQFKKKPNVYYIQPDGYTNKPNLDGSIYDFDNHDFEGYLSSEGFTTYTNYRSNYYSTLLSNSSMFSMKHHYLQPDVEEFNARNVIMSNNPVLQVFKNNGYTTHFITERPYLLISRPKLGYDTANFAYSELPYLKDAWEYTRDETADFKNMKTSPGPHFYFIEKMLPGHISVFTSGGKDDERKAYLDKVRGANVWLMELIAQIEKKDPDGIIVIAADHGGFVGFETSLQSQEKTDNPLLVKSMFGALCAIRWNADGHEVYGKSLKTSVNLFRVLFAFLSEDKALLNNLQDDASYIDAVKPKGRYRYIDAQGNIVFQKIE